MAAAAASTERDGDGTMVVQVTGDWSLRDPTPDPAPMVKEVEASPPPPFARE
jgi:hypothetical protein